MSGKFLGSTVIRRQGAGNSASRLLLLLFAAAILLALPQRGSAAQSASSQPDYRVRASLAGANTIPAGSTVRIRVTGLQHSVAASDLRLTLTPVHRTVDSIEVPALSADDQGSGVYLVSAQLPETLGTSRETRWAVEVAGSDTRGAKFSAVEGAVVDVTPAASILSISPATGRVGQTLTVTITGSGTSFVQGTTQASFGAGIAVGGATAGAAGPVTVKSATVAVASLVIGATAATGVRSVTVKTGAQSETSAKGFTVEAALKPPIINPGGPYTGTAGKAVDFNGSLSKDTNYSTLTLTWQFGDKTTATGVTVNHTYASAGTYTVTLTGVDTYGEKASATTSATIAAAVLPPVADAGGPYTGTAGKPVAFSGAGSKDPNGFALTYTWVFGDGSSGSGVSPSHTYSRAGTYTVSLTVNNGHGKTNTATTKATIAAAVKPPVAKAGGPYTGVAGKPLTLDGSRSTDPYNYTLTYSWSFGDGDSGTGVKPTHTYTAVGTYTIKLTVEDGHGNSDSATSTATITAVPEPVAAPGGPYTGTATEPVTFSGSKSTDPRGYGLTYTWEFGDKSSGTGVSPVHTYAAAGTYTVSLTVNDGHSGTDTATTKATISAYKEPVVNPGGPYTGTAMEPVSFNGSASSDPEKNTLTYSWQFGDGSTASGADPTHTYAKAGTFTVTLTVTDTHGGTATGTTTATIAAYKEPVANAGGPYAGKVGTAITFSGAKSSDPEGNPLTYAWNFGDSSTGTGVSPTHAYANAGTFNVSLTVTDTHGGTATAKTTATITAPPVANPGGPYTGIPAQAIQFDGTQSYDPQGQTLTYAWNFGDKGTSNVAQPSHTYTTAGTYTVTLTVSDATSSGSATTTATITPVVGMAILTPTAGTLTNKPTISVTGTVADATATVSVNGTAATVSSGNWTASGVALREGVNLITATATAKSGATGTASVSVTLDTTPPAVSIVAPATGAKVFSPQLAVSGLVSDLVAGTVNAQDVTVSVNGVPASVSNRSFSAANVLLSPGLNTVTALAIDKAGNRAQSSVQVNYQAQITQQTILLVSGSGQSGVINSTLAQPLIVQLVAANGQPVAGRPVTFTVTRSDGQVEVLPSQGNTLSVLSDANGKASVLFQLGSRAGVGINQVTASSPGFTGQALFTATSTVDTPAAIHPVIGDHQRGIIGQNAPRPFQVIVSDRAGNPLENVPVTFTVTAGGGNIGGESTVTQKTNTDGKATVTVTLGMQEGIDNNLVTADYTGDTGSPVTFHASGLVPAAPSQTTVTGIVLDNTNTPVPGATARLEGTNLTTTTNAQGQFTLTGVPVGTVTLLVDGSTSSSTITYPSLSFVLQALPGVANSLDMPIYLPAIDTENAQTVGGDQPVTLTMTGVPGVAFTVAPNSVTFPDGTHVGTMSVSQVKRDMVPMPPVNGVSAPLVWTIQPAGAKFNPPIQVQLPNTDGLAPGTVTEIYQYDHDLEQFVSAGTARVSPDGSVIVSDPGFGIAKAGWGHNLPPEPPNNCTISCNEHSDCTQDYVTPQCTCRHNAINVGGKCNGSNSMNNPCYDQGTCDAYGHCTNSGKSKDGNMCDDHLYCTNPDMCKDGTCVGKPMPDQDQGNLTVGVDLGSIFEPLQGFSDTFFPNELSFQVNQSSSGKLSCCEKDMGKMEQKKNDKYNMRIQASKDYAVPGIAIPPIPFPGAPIKAGVYTNLGSYVQAGLGAYYDKCADSVCVTADQSQLSVQIGLVLKLEGGPPGAMLKFNAGLSITATAQLNTTNCKTLDTEFSLGAVKASWTVYIPYTKVKLPGSTTNLFQGIKIPGQSYTFKNN